MKDPQLVAAIRACRRSGWTLRDIRNAFAQPWPHRFTLSDESVQDIRGLGAKRLALLKALIGGLPEADWLALPGMSWREVEEKWAK